MSKYWTLLKEKVKLSGSMSFLPKAMLIFEKWNLKDLRLMHASEHSQFQSHNDLGKINNTDESKIFLR